MRQVLLPLLGDPVPADKVFPERAPAQAELAFLARMAARRAQVPAAALVETQQGRG